MMKILLIAMFSLLLFVNGCGGSSGSSSSTQTPSNPTPQPSMSPPPQVASALTQADARIGACINMANHLEPPNEGDWGRPISTTDFIDLANKGFETVRLPVRFSNHAATTAPFTINSDFMNRVADVVDLAFNANIRVILDLHHYSDPQGNIFEQPTSQVQRFAQIWKQIAERFATYDDKRLWFELLNEPHANLTHQNLLEVLTPALAEVRKTNPTRPVVIGGENFSNVTSLQSLPLPNDAYIIATFHYYDPFFYTHQGAPFITPVPPLGVIFTQSDRAQFERDVATAQDFMNRTGVPLLLGEYGAFDSISITERAEYYNLVSSGFRAINIDGCPWGYTNTFSFRDPNTNQWFDELLSAIGL